MSVDKDDVNIKIENSPLIKENKKISIHLLKQMKKQNSLFSEIMRNHSENNTPIFVDQNIKKVDNNIFKKSINFNIKNVPLPNIDFSIKNCSYKLEKLDKYRKRSVETKSEITAKRMKAARSVEDGPKPRMCERRTHNRQGSTWGERSVKAFKILTEVGEGTYGHVFKAYDRQTNTVKALKKVRLENEKEGFPLTTVREIKILQQLNHPNIVKLHEVVTDYDLNENNSHGVKDKGFYLVFEYMDHDLYGILDSGITLNELQIASIIKQILEGINYSHKKMFLHRDIKCSNILINNRGEVKIADYGLSRRYYDDNKKRLYTNKVITLWYRAPELLLGEECYGTSIDLWSIGCIMGELFTHRTMFTANVEMEQMDAISRVCGTPCPATWPDVTKLPLFQSYRPKYSNKRRLREYYFTVPNNALDVLDWMLQLDPKRRCNADQALRSFWLKKIDVRQIVPPQFPTDGDYHELSCKRRHKQNRSDTGYKSSKSSIKEQVKSSNSSNLSLDDAAQSSVPSSQLQDDMLNMLNNGLHNIIPDEETIKKLLQSSSLSNGDDIKEKLERILEPYIKKMWMTKNIVSSTCLDSGGSDALSTLSEPDDCRQ